MRVGAQGAVGNHAKLHAAAVAEDGHAQAYVTGLRHPEHVLLNRRAAKLELVARAGHIGHHRCGLLAKQTEHGVLRGLNQQARHRQQTKRQQGLVAALHLGHAAAHFVHALNWIGHANGKHQRSQAKAVAQFVSLVQRTQIHWHHGADFFARGVVAMAFEVFAQGTGHTTEQHVIDRAIERFAHGPHFVQRNRRAPGHPLGGAGFALQTGGRVVGHQGQRGQIAHQLHAQLGHVQRTRDAMAWVTQHVQGFGSAVARCAQGLDRQVGKGLEQGVGNPIFRPGRRSLLFALGRRQATIDQGGGDRYQGNAVGNAVVDAHHERTAALIVLHQVELPQRPLAIQRRHGELGQSVLQGLLLAAFGLLGQLLHHHMFVDIKAGVVYPSGPGGVFHHPLRKAPVLEQPILHPLHQRGLADARLEHPHAHNHHQVAGTVHAQPGGVHLGHALARNTQRTAHSTAYVFAHGFGRLGGCRFCTGRTGRR